MIMGIIINLGSYKFSDLLLIRGNQGDLNNMISLWLGKNILDPINMKIKFKIKQCKTMQNNAKQCKTMQNNAKQCK